MTRIGAHNSPELTGLTRDLALALWKPGHEFHDTVRCPKELGSVDLYLFTVFRFSDFQKTVFIGFGDFLKIGKTVSSFFLAFQRSR